MFKVIRSLASLRADVRGNAIITFGLVLPLLTTVLAGGVDYARWLSLRSDVQTAADMSALAGAKEMRLANANIATVTAVSRARAIAALGTQAPGATVQVLPLGVNTLQVQIDVVSKSLFGRMAPAALSHIHAQATAQTASTPTCLIALDPKGKGLVLKTAAIIANGCAAYSDSQKTNALSLNLGTLEAAQTCSAGGVSLKVSVVLPAPISDCPVISDPLAGRAPPPVGACLDLGGTSGKTYVVSGGTQTLSPGNYCGGLKITNGAIVSFSPGVYVISDGSFALDKGSSIQGNKVGFYFTGNNAVLNFDLQSSVNLVAPADGPMAGILFFEDRTVKVGNNHSLGSQNAPQLLGTIYFSRGDLTIGAPVAGALQSQLVLDITTCSKLSLTYPCSPTAVLSQLSAWTIIIANQITVNFIISLQLNSNYSANTTAPPSEITFKGAALAE